MKTTNENFDAFHSNPIPTKMNNATDNFDALWSNLKDRVAEARTKHKANGMCTVSTKDEYWPGRVSVMQPTNGSATVSVNVNLLSSCGTKMTADELRRHAAHCLAAAEEIEAATVEAAAVPLAKES